MKGYHQIKDIIMLLEIYFVAVRASFSSMLEFVLSSLPLLWWDKDANQGGFFPLTPMASSQGGRGGDK